MTAQRPLRPGEDDATLAPRERALLEESVRPIGARSRGTTLTIVLVVAAFVIGLVRPWDWLPAGGAVPGIAGTTNAPGGAAIGVTGPAATVAASPAETPAPGSDAAAAQTCAYPQSWRSATIQDWAGRRARVWTAVDATVASGPLDPAIQFQVVAGDTFTAVGWCAPVLGPDRPPLEARGTLFRIDGGTAVQEPYRRLEPAAPNALGELWAPEGAATWRPGYYVIRVATTTGTYVRWLGLELRLSPAVATPVPSAGGPSPATPTSSPVASPSP